MRLQQQQQQRAGRQPPQRPPPRGQPPPPSSGGRAGAAPPPPPQRGAPHGATAAPPSPSRGQPQAPDNEYIKTPDFDYEDFITRFYQKLNPDGLKNIPEILRTFVDHDVMLIKLFEKYEVPFEQLPTKRSRAIGRRVQSEGWESFQKHSK